ncbi:ATP-dependent RNA helicase RhlE [Botrimarina colliarenosi]|uniref:DEAD-box ATP-dependent RNA helicase RhpA n=1 Tax=Botrimarina colliarenosi TaxID=2528001 RepID=A0A5C6ALX6_9BACT|nr:DEAD/DEAH box helicase [Botrimarina colliarenosi]TWU00421.1 ATP-dependent RNA helicase RhlE [Botrimarina colliarenosi]
MKFSDLGLAEPFSRAVADLGYEIATPIQAKAIPIVLEGRDLIGCAQTGTGKTAAFTLPMLDLLIRSLPESEQNEQRQPKRPPHPKGSRPKPRPIRALVLSPTRELAAQIGASLDRYGKHTALRNTIVFGGVSQFNQVKALRHGVDALIATPGRLLDLMNQGHIDLSKVEILVFDEADQMLDMGFLPDLKRIVKKVPARRQTLMFSATMPDAIRELAQEWLTRPASVEVAAVSTPADRIAQSTYLVDRNRKLDLLVRFLGDTPRGRTLVFSRTKHGADKIVKHLEVKGFEASAIHGNKSQGARNRALAQFKGKNPPVLVATDIAARGLDINNVTHIVNFDLPEVAETYVHRIGRTARAGAEGSAVSFCCGDERGLLRQIERLMKMSIPVEPTITGFEPTEPVNNGPLKKKGGGGGGRGRQAGPRGPVKLQTSGKPRRPRKAKPSGGSGSSGGNRSGGGATATARPAGAKASGAKKKRHRAAV